MNMLHRSPEQDTQDQPNQSSIVNSSQSNANDKEAFEATPPASVGSFTSSLSQEPHPSNDQPMCHISKQIPPEEAKSTSPSNKKQSVEEIVWEWQSEPDPLSSEPKQWRPYNTIENDLLEKAYQNKERQVILDEWVVHVSDKYMFQQRRDNPSQQIHIRRMKINVNGDMDHMKEEISKGQRFRRLRFIEGETPKTYTTAFGSLDDYLSFFEKRTPEMASFAETFKKIESTKDVHILSQDIVPFVIESIQTEARKCNKKPEKSLIMLFQMLFTTLEEFYGIILKAYTMETFLYKNLNQYLRNEDWIQLDDLLPYAFLVCKAFQCSELTSTCNKYLQQSGEHEQHPSEPLTLYRGAQFDEVLLSSYNPKAISTFSWNAVTSTSTNPCVAEIFSQLSNVPGKIPVIFEIEVPISNRLNLIDIKTLSESPDENEVVLPPGSIFELISSTRDQKRAQIKLRLISDASELAFQGKIMHGAMHAQVSKGTVAKIICQERKELAEALQHLKGNRMVEEFECTLCKFDAKAAVIFSEVLMTLPKLSKIALTSLSFDQDIYLKTMLKGLGKSKIRDIEVSDRLLGNDNQIMFFMEEVRDLKCLASLKLHFRNTKTLDNNPLKRIVDGGLRYLTSLKNLTLDFTRCEIRDEGMKSLCSEGLKHLTSLTTLALVFGWREEIRDEEMKSLCSEGLKHLISLRTLTLHFEVCKKITDEGMKSLSTEGLKHLTSLTILTLDFDECTKITDEGIKSLCSEGLKHLTSLTDLTLNVRNCPKITDEGIKSLCSEGLKNLTSLTTLTLNFGRCAITDEGMKSLCSEGLKHLTSLTTLILDFSVCKITAEGMKSLCYEGLKHLTSLTTLTLTFRRCPITDEGMKSLCSEELKHLTSLTTLNLDLGYCDQITNEGMRSFCCWIRYLTSLTDLTLDVENCSEVTDEGLNYLRAQCDALNISLVLSKRGLRDTGVFDLRRNLNFKGIIDLENQTVSQSFSLEYLNPLGSWSKTSRFYTDYKEREELQILEKLEINYYELQYRVSADPMNKLLRHMVSLKTLAIDFEGYSITDEKVRDLFSEGLRHLTSLTVLALDFSNWSCLTDEGVKSLSSEGLRHLTSLTTLSLNFGHIWDLTDEGVKSLCSEGLRYLISLINLKVDFSSSSRITDYGLNVLQSEADSLGMYSIKSSEPVSYDQKRIFNFIRKINVEDVSKLSRPANLPLSLQCLDSLELDSKTFDVYSNYDDKEKLQLLEDLEIKYRVLQKKVSAGPMKRIYSERFSHMISLVTLTMEGEQFTNEEVRDLFSEGLRYLTSLRTLSIWFRTCKEITDKGMKSLSEGLRHLTSLTVLALDFRGCSQITNVGMKSLSEGLRHLNSLTTLALHFKRWTGITDEELKSLSSEGLRYLTSLMTLTLDFEGCIKISDGGMKNLSSEGLRHLTSLITLDLCFEDCEEITDEGMKSLSEGLRHLTSLTKLTLGFRYCNKITDKGMKSLSLDSLKYLYLLRSLTLDFVGCQKMTDEGVQSLCFDGLRFLNFLTRLNFDISDTSFSETSFKEIEEFLKYFKFYS